MQEYKRIDISKDEIVPIAERMRRKEVILVMIHGFLDKDGNPDISYEYAVGPVLESYHVVGETVVPSISEIYDVAAEWPERELNELFGWTFEGLDVSKRLFLPYDLLEDEGKGLNLTWEVRDGIVNHSMSRLANTLEGRIVRLSDKIAYINHDMDDAIRAGILSEDDVPKEIANVLGATRKARLDFLVKNIIENSIDRDDIVMSQEAFEAMIDLRQFMFDNLYFNSSCKTEEYKAEGMVITLYDYYLDHQEKLPDDIKALITDKNTKPERAVCDYISGINNNHMIITKAFCSMYSHKVKVIRIVFLRPDRPRLFIINKIGRFCKVIPVEAIPTKKQDLRIFILRNQTVHYFFHTLAYKEVFTSFTLVFLSVNFFRISFYNDWMLYMLRRYERLAYLTEILLYEAPSNIDYLLCIAISLSNAQFQTISKCIFEVRKQCDVRTCICIN